MSEPRDLDYQHSDDEFDGLLSNFFAEVYRCAHENGMAAASETRTEPHSEDLIAHPHAIALQQYYQSQLLARREPQLPTEELELAINCLERRVSECRNSMVNFSSGTDDHETLRICAEEDERAIAAIRALLKPARASNAATALLEDCATLEWEPAVVDPNRVRDLLQQMQFVFGQIAIPQTLVAAARYSLERLLAAQTAAARDVLAERRRQEEKEGYDTAHDDEHGDGAMALAAAAYILQDFGVPVLGQHIRGLERRALWPWHPKYWNPKDPRANLIRAGALILAEIERRDRAANSKDPK